MCCHHCPTARLKHHLLLTCTARSSSSHSRPMRHSTASTVLFLAGITKRVTLDLELGIQGVGARSPAAASSFRCIYTALTRRKRVCMLCKRHPCLCFCSAGLPKQSQSQSQSRSPTPLPSTAAPTVYTSRRNVFFSVLALELLPLV